MTDSDTYNYSTTKHEAIPGRASSYSSQKYDDLVNKYLNQRTTLAVNQGIGNQSNLSRSVINPSLNTENSSASATGNQQLTQNAFGSKTAYYQSSSQQPLGDDFYSKYSNYQIKDIAPQNQQVEDAEKVKRSKVKFETTSNIVKSDRDEEKDKSIQDSDANNMNFNTDLNVPDYQPMIVGVNQPQITQTKSIITNEKQSAGKTLSSSKTQIVYLENPEQSILQRSSTNNQITRVSQNEIKSILDQNITICNIF